MGVDLVSVGLACADVMVRPIEDFPERGKLKLIPRLELHLGGLAGVTAAVYSQLGGSAAFVGKLGNDGFGDYLINTLQLSGVDVSHVKRESSLATPATVVLIGEDGERTFVHHQGASLEFVESDVDLGFVSQAKALHWGGPSVTPGLDGAPAGRIMKAARDAGLITSLDTCFDGQGRWFELIRDALPHCQVVMSSIEEARHYTGRNEADEIADFYLSEGPAVAVIKLGAAGILVKSATERHHVPAHKVTPLDTTGAGDAACGGFLYGWLRQWSLLECARLANAVGGLTVQKMGGAEAVTSLDDTLAFMKDGAA